MTRGTNHSRVHEIDIEVRYVETDQMGVVHHSKYLVWFELARTALCELSGTTYPEIERMGYWLMVTSAQVDYRAPARYGDVVRVGAWVDRIGSRVLDFGYHVHRLSNGERQHGQGGAPKASPVGRESLLARGTTHHRWVNASSGKICRVPEELLDGFRDLAPESPT